MTLRKWSKVMPAYLPLKTVEFLMTKVCHIYSVRSASNGLLLFAEDELQNVEMAEEERTKKNNEMKIKKRDYTGYDDDEFTDGTAGMKRAVLAKYDEDIEGARNTVSVPVVVVVYDLV